MGSIFGGYADGARLCDLVLQGGVELDGRAVAEFHAGLHLGGGAGSRDGNGGCVRHAFVLAKQTVVVEVYEEGGIEVGGEGEGENEALTAEAVNNELGT